MVLGLFAIMLCFKEAKHSKYQTKNQQRGSICAGMSGSFLTLIKSIQILGGQFHPEQGVNLKRNGGSRWSGIYNLYTKGGVRCVEVGSLMFGKYSNEQGQLITAQNELVTSGYT
jgi:hypothetical protein